MPGLPTASSVHSQSTEIDLWVDEGGWNIPKLLNLSDTTRATLSKGKKLSFSELEDLNFVLDIMLIDKLGDDDPSKASTITVPKVTFAAIQRARLDKLLADMLKAYEREMTSINMHGIVVETGLGSEIEAASRLQKYWQSRFKSDYFFIDKYRFDSLLARRLQDVSFSAVASDGLGVWVPKESVECSEAESNMRFIPGQ